MRESAKVAGLPAFPIMYSRPGPVTYTDIYGKLYREGLRLVHLDATCGDDYYSPELRAWHGDGKFDYTVQADGWKRLIEVGPDFRFCLRVYVGSPAWWDDAHPTELQRYADGSSTREFPHTARTSVPSLASEVWRRDSCLAIARFLDWLQWSGWSQRVWGIFPCFGITWEWGILGTDGMPDYSEPMQRRFRAWLNEHYGDVDRLRAAWGDSSISFDSANIPDADSRFRGDGDLRQYPRDRASFDYQRCLSDANVELLNAYGEAIRAHSGDRYHVGAFYGYTLTAREHSFLMGRMGSGGLMGGHHSLARYEDGGVFDFIASPYAYSNRNLEDGVIMPHFPHAGTQARGLHGYEENDLHTFTNWMTINLPISVGQTGELRRSILHQRLAFASAVCRGASYWLTEITDSRRLGVEISNYSDEPFSPRSAATYAPSINWPLPGDRR